MIPGKPPPPGIYDNGEWKGTNPHPGEKNTEKFFN
jgi:hypothetical protein